MVDGTGLEPTDIECPEVDDPEDGTTFQCTLTVDGQLLRMNGTVTDAAEGTVEVANAEAVLFVDLLERTVAEDLTEQLDAEVRVDCGDTEVRVEEVGTAFTCRADDEFGAEGEVVVEVLDIEGNVTYELADTAG